MKAWLPQLLAQAAGATKAYVYEAIYEKKSSDRIKERSILSRLLIL